MTIHPDVVKRIEKRVGTTLRGKYKLDRLLGVGGAGSVFAATHRNGTHVALKILHPELAKRTEMRTRFLREGYVANKIHHHGVVRILDDDDDDDDKTVFLVMDLLEGEPLERRWERCGRRLPLVDALARIDDVLDVLAAAHQEGIVHRDVKPENVFVTNDNATKVLDFGIARLLDGSGATRTGEVFGTPAFMPPEQAAGRVHEIDGRSDLWSVGAVMFTLLTGVHVHEASHVTQQMIRAATTPARPVAEVMPAMPSAIARVVDRALAFRSEERWPNAQEMQAALRATGIYKPRGAVPVPGPVLQAARTIYGEGLPMISKTSTLVQGGGGEDE